MNSRVSNASLIYQPLQDTEIRLVEVHALQETSTAISCTLVQGRLGSLSFMALSYVWGSVSETVEISLNDKPFNVTVNLEAFLRKSAHNRALTDPDNTDTSYIWIDALCIDQSNVSERNSQVKMMDSIYSHAMRVGVWLGLGGYNMKLAIDRIREMSRVTVQLGGIQGIFKPENRAAASMHLQETMNGESNGRKEFFDFFRSPWWTRLWVLQEVALAKSVTFICGDESVSFEHVYNTMLQIYVCLAEDPVSTIKSLNFSTEEEAIIGRAANVINTRGIFENNNSDRLKSTRLQSLLGTTEGAKATDFRDKIYGLLGMLSDPGKAELSPRYDMAVEHLYVKVVVWFLKQYDSLSILGQCFCGYSQNLLLMPSWVPHWEPKDKEDGGPSPFHWEEYENLATKSVLKPYSASNNLPLSSHSWSVNEERGTLSLTGAHLGTLTFLSEPARVSASMAQEDLFAQARQWLALGERLSDKYEFTGESTNLALRRTLVGDFLSNSLASGNTAKSKQRHFMLMLPEDPILENDGFKWDYRDSFLQFMIMANRRRVGFSSEGWIGLVPETAVVGDKIVVLIGGPMLYIVSDLYETDHDLNNEKSIHSLVGEAYFHGFVDGRALEGRQLETIVLV